MKWGRKKQRGTGRPKKRTWSRRSSCSYTRRHRDTALRSCKSRYYFSIINPYFFWKIRVYCGWEWHTWRAFSPTTGGYLRGILQTRAAPPQRHSRMPFRRGSPRCFISGEPLTSFNLVLLLENISMGNETSRETKTRLRIAHAAGLRCLWKNSSHPCATVPGQVLITLRCVTTGINVQLK